MLMLSVASAALVAGPSISSVRAQQNPIVDPKLKASSDEPMLLQADQLIYDNKNNRVRAEGNVEVFYNNHTVLADLIVYDRGQNVLNAEGNVRIKEPDGAVVKADRIRLTDDFREGFIRSLRIHTKEEASITADKATRTSGNTTVFENASFTPCKVCEDQEGKPPTWRIKAMRIIHDKTEQTIEYENMSFEFLGVPIATLPYFKHPDPSKKRQSGFLMPTATYSDRLGFVTETPYYFALSPNYDATVTPVVTTRQGEMLKGEWGHKLANGGYKVDFAGAYNESPDEQTPGGRKFRGSIVSQGNFNVGTFWDLGWDATVESDEKFRRFYKLDDIKTTDRVSQVYLTGLGDRNYFGLRAYHFGGLVINDNENANSFVHPLLDYNYVMANPVMGGEVSFNANAVALTREDTITAAGWSKDWRHVSRESKRVSAEVGWRRELIDPVGQVYKPFASAQGDVYGYQDPADDENKTVTRTSAAAGMEYRFPFVGNLGVSTHVFEPIAQAIYRPDTNKNQDRLPNEDSQSLVYDDTLLFDTDKFSGYDRLETGSRANVGVRYTLSLPDGASIRSVFGQSYQLNGENPFPTDSGLDTARSDYVAGVYFEPSSHFGVVAQGRFDQADMTLRRTDIGSWAVYGPFSLSANYVRQTPKLDIDASDPNTLVGEEVSGNAGIALTDRWSLTGKLTYDLSNDYAVTQGVGLKYADECFNYGVNYERTNTEDGEIKPDTTISVFFNLKYIGGYQASTSANDLSSKN
jgi:LPS-assembly protein